MKSSRIDQIRKVASEWEFDKRIPAPSAARLLREMLSLVESYQRSLMHAEQRLREVSKLLEENGCECPCDHHWEERGPECEVCLACLIEEALGQTQT